MDELHFHCDASLRAKVDELARVTRRSRASLLREWAERCADELLAGYREAARQRKPVVRGARPVVSPRRPAALRGRT